MCWYCRCSRYVCLRRSWQVTLTKVDYLDTTILLDQADPSFGNTLGLTEATSSGLSSPDGGKTWAVGTISHKAFTFNFPS